MLFFLPAEEYSIVILQVLFLFLNIKMCEVDEESFICESLDDIDDLIKKKCVPTQTQIRQQLGSKLSDVFFENITSEARAWLGLEPPLVGPDTLWIDPEARLKNKVSVTPVPEPAAIRLKAFTHESILDVGEKYIKLLENKHRIQMEAALKRQAEELEEEWRRKFADANDSNIVDGSGQCKKVVATLMEHFDKCFEDLVKSTQLRMRKECLLRVEDERAEIAAYMLTQLQEEVERRDLELCNDFHDILYSELNILASRYIKQINKEREIAVQLLQETVRKYEKMLKELKMEMEFSTVVDICRAITRERVECNDRIRKIESEYRAKQGELLEFIEDLKAQNCTLQKMSTERLKRLMLWRKKVRQLLLEFQRFINFALKSIPGQSEFLLSVEKLMLKNYPEDSFLVPEEYLHFKNCLKGKQLSENEYFEEKPEKLTESDESDEENSELSEKSFECCDTIEYLDKPECNLNFDYYTFKSMLVCLFGYNRRKMKRRKTSKKTVCLWKKKSKGISIDKSSELYQMLTLVGESEREHVIPVDCFLKKRLKAVLKICENDPEFAKIMLGCSD